MCSASDTRDFPKASVRAWVHNIPPVSFKQDIAQAFLKGFEQKTQSTDEPVPRTFNPRLSTQ
jgi:hypothetical protein